MRAMSYLASRLGRAIARQLARPLRRPLRGPLRRAGPFALALLLLAAAPAPSAPPGPTVELAQIAAYLNGIHTLKAHFLQVAPNGTVSEGTTWLERPGRMRFAYAPPSPLLLVAGDGLVMFHDASLGQTSTVPIASTPLGILLARHVRLDGPVVVTGLRHLPGEVTLTLHRRARPEGGSLTLVFTTRPLLLRQWTVTDAQHQRTTITLENIETGGKFPQSLFDVAVPLQPGTGVGGG